MVLYCIVLYCVDIVLLKLGDDYSEADFSKRKCINNKYSVLIL
jgi:hypothetical protein